MKLLIFMGIYFLTLFMFEYSYFFKTKVDLFS